MRVIYAGVFVFAVFMSCGCGRGTTSSTGGGSKGNAANAQELEQLKGTWQVIAIEAAGKPVPADRVQKINLQYVFDGDQLTIRRPDRPNNRSTFTLDAGANPKKITINNSPPLRAVYAVEGNQLRLCLMVDENLNAGYPTELASKASPKTDLLTLERR
jgi:uncharacterized protein (TIGR03067 family)